MEFDFIQTRPLELLDLGTPLRTRIDRAAFVSGREPFSRNKRQSGGETVTQITGAVADALIDSGAPAPKDDGMLSRCDLINGAAVALLTFSIQSAWAQETRMNLFKIVTIKDEIVVGLSTEELQALGGNDASAVAHALAQKGDLTVWQYNVHRGPNGDLQQAPTARIGLLANASLRVEPYATTYQILPHP
jgi:hypothetical protein